MFSWELFYQAPIVGILRHFSPMVVSRILALYSAAGLTTIEITMNTKGAAGIIREAVDEFGEKLNIGAGTVCTEEDLEEALRAGAGFIVTPVINETVIKIAVERSIPVFPGAFTPTEIYKAWSLGGSFVKVFPATFLGADYIKEVKAPLNHIRLIPTGGVSLENMTKFFDKGADAVGMGSQLFPKQWIDNENWDELSNHFKKFAETYQNYKNRVK